MEQPREMEIKDNSGEEAIFKKTRVRISSHFLHYYRPLCIKKASILGKVYCAVRLGLN